MLAPASLFAVGPDAAAVEASGEPPSAVAEHAMRYIKRFVQAAFDVPATSVPAPSSVHVTDWGRDPASAGAYSYLRVGGEWNDSDMLCAAVSMHPEHAAAANAVPDGVDWEDSVAAAARSALLPGPVLWWGGEACQGEYMGTMHAALLSGRAAAQGILRHRAGRQTTPAAAAADACAESAGLA